MPTMAAVAAMMPAPCIQIVRYISALREWMPLQFRPEREDVCLEFRVREWMSPFSSALNERMSALSSSRLDSVARPLVALSTMSATPWAARSSRPASVSLRAARCVSKAIADPVMPRLCQSPGRARAPAAGGCAPHTPIPDERAARLWPTHPPSDFLLCGGFAPTPPSGSGRTHRGRTRVSCGGCAPTPPQLSQGGPAPSPLAGEGGPDSRGSGGEKTESPLPQGRTAFRGEQRIRGRPRPLTPTLSPRRGGRIRGRPRVSSPPGEGAGFEGDRASSCGGCAPTPPSGTPCRRRGPSGPLAPCGRGWG